MIVLRTLALALSLVALLATGQAHRGPAANAAMNTPRAEAARPAASAAPRQVANDSQYAQYVVDRLASRYRYLDGVTVTMGTTPRGREAVAYYTKGEIVISDRHTVSIDEILAHEVWHIIDWRDNGRLDWGEDLPPKNTSAYLKH